LKIGRSKYEDWIGVTVYINIQLVQLITTSSSLSPISEKHILSFISLTFHCLSNDQHLDHFGILLTTFWSTGHIWSFYILWCTWLIQTHRWVEFNSCVLLICVHEHRFLQMIFHRDLGKNILLGVFILNYFSIMSICNVGF
jgi:hypothetical protein